MKFEAGKTYKTRDGREARVYATDGKGTFCLHGAIRDNIGWFSCEWNSKGEHGAGCIDNYDLMPLKREAWVNVYGDGHGYLHPSRRAADDWTDPKSRIACIKIEYTEGEGL